MTRLDYLTRTFRVDDLPHQLHVW